MTRVRAFVLDWLQRRCSHPAGSVVADILQADALPLAVSWCCICGAYSVNHHSPNGIRYGKMRRPRPRWAS